MGIMLQIAYLCANSSPYVLVPPRAGPMYDLLEFPDAVAVVPGLRLVGHLVEVGVDAVQRQQFSWLPISTMLPVSSTTMRSASRIVESRWAMTNEVRPFSSCSSACWMMTSVCVSTFAVASSSTRMRGSATHRAGEADQLALAEREVLAALVQHRCRTRAPAAR